MAALFPAPCGDQQQSTFEHGQNRVRVLGTEQLPAAQEGFTLQVKGLVDAPGIVI